MAHVHQAGRAKLGDGLAYHRKADAGLCSQLAHGFQPLTGSDVTEQDPPADAVTQPLAQCASGQMRNVQRP